MNKNTLEGSCIDKAMADLFDALDLASRIQKATNLADTKRLAGILQQNLALGINGIAPIGVHAERRWAAYRKFTRD